MRYPPRNGGRHQGTSMTRWVDVVTQPLGLAGFALFLVFGYAARTKERRAKQWLRPVAIVFAFLSLAAGTVLSYINVSRAPEAHSPSDPRSRTSQGSLPHVEQKSTGPGSPNIQGISGDVHITINQSDPTTSATTDRRGSQ